MTRFFLCTTHQVEPDTVVKVDLPNCTSLAVYNVGGRFYVTDDTCTHAEASLAEGEIMDGQIVCPFHGGAFDIETGAATCSPCVIPLRTYAVCMDGENLYVEIE